MDNASLRFVQRFHLPRGFACGGHRALMTIIHDLCFMGFTVFKVDAEVAVKAVADRAGTVRHAIHRCGVHIPTVQD